MHGEDACPARGPADHVAGTLPVRRIVSGGQTGPDRAALDAALALGMPCGGWCPRDRQAEDGPIDRRYGLTETDSADPAVRTRRNVADAGGTLIIAPPGPLSGGTALTAREAEALGRPCLVVDPAAPDAPQAVARWLRRHRIAVLNVAGPRQSEAPGLYRPALRLLMAVLSADPRPPAADRCRR